MLRWFVRNLTILSIGFGVVCGLYVTDTTKAWAATSMLCHPCTSSHSCGQGGVCVGGQTGAGYCTEPCAADGSCPTGFACTWIAPGLQQCMPNKQGCFATCDNAKPCPTGFQCNNGRCLRNNGGEQGDFCDDKAPCRAEYNCLTNQNGASRCAKICGPAWGEAGSPCKEGKCNAGLSCISYGSTPVCVQECQGTCTAQQICTTVGAKSYCTCKDDKECPTGEFCNKGVFGFQGACTKDPFASNPNPCGAGLSCQPFVGHGYMCLPKDGVHDHGMMCSAFLPCRSGFKCYQYTQQVSALCYRDCMTADTCQAQGLGKCDFIGRTGNFCFCATDQDCGQGHTCQTIPDIPFNHGLCRPGPKSTCTQNQDCPIDYACVQTKCTLSTAPKEPGTSEDSVAPSESVAEAREATTTEPISPPEPVSEATTQDATTEKIPESAASESTPFEPAPSESAVVTESSPSDAKNTEDITITIPKACGCQSDLDVNMGMLLLLGLGVLLLMVNTPRYDKR